MAVEIDVQVADACHERGSVCYRREVWRSSWGNETERNHMLHESAVPISQLYEPLFQMDDTFVLQEYFCPRSRFEAWIRTRPIYEGLAASKEVVLLNTTIRFVERDADTFLPYAKHEGGMFAFVLCYRLPRTASADAKMREIHHLFVKETLALKGSFYLPYRSMAQIESCSTLAGRWM